MLAKGLSEKGKSSLVLLRKVSLVKNFYLAGGTGCALHLGHRVSFDLYFICQKQDLAQLLSFY
ncbi:MAG TPA: hypothetical protein PK644_00980 [bacterium]|nr:hypothetical protein [bacterium]